MPKKFVQFKCKCCCQKKTFQKFSFSILNDFIFCTHRICIQNDAISISLADSDEMATTILNYKSNLDCHCFLLCWPSWWVSVCACHQSVAVLFLTFSLLFPHSMLLLCALASAHSIQWHTHSDWESIKSINMVIGTQWQSTHIYTHTYKEVTLK